MKKGMFLIMTVLLLTILSGCKKANKVLVTDAIEMDTMLVKADGTAQSGTIEEFGEAYYDLSELDAFVTKEIEKYNQSVNEEAIAKVSLELKKENAVLILNYSSLEHYNAFNEGKSSLYSTADALEIKNLPDSFISEKKGETVSKETALKDGKHKVLLVEADTDVIVEGNIIYYNNAVLLDKHTIQAGSKGTSIVIFKP